MIFISHTHLDKPIVEEIALRLRDIFGQEKVFYDSWSIQPGDGIMDKMNKGLDDCEIFLFCISKNSLQSKMVTLEWQNGLMKTTRWKAKFIPIKIDDCFMPPILLQSLYIDLFGQGIEVALRQIVDVTTWKNTFQNPTQGFSNLRAYKYDENGKIIIECHAEHYLEAISSFLFLTKNTQEEMEYKCKSDSMYLNWFNKDVRLDNWSIYNAVLAGTQRGTPPGFPFIIEFSWNNDVQIDIVWVMHEKQKWSWKMIPLAQGRRK